MGQKYNILWIKVENYNPENRRKYILLKFVFYNVMQRFVTIIYIYKPLFLWSFLINILLVTASQNIYVAVLTKLFLFILILFFLNETKTKSRFFVSENLDIIQMKLFAMVFVLDTLITTLFFKILNVFI